MKRNNKIITIACIIILIFSINTKFTTTPSVNGDSEEKDILLDAQTTPLIINNDADLASFSSAGDGNASTPWIIRDYVIDTTDTFGIYITGTTEYFEIRNCTISASSYALYILSIADSTAHIENNTCVDTGLGIVLNSMTGTTIQDNDLINNGDGISVGDCNNTSIIDNYIVTSGFDFGIRLIRSPYTTLSGNDMIGCSITLDFDYEDNITTISSTGDTVNGLPVLLSVNDNNVIFDTTYSQVLIVNGSNILLKNQVLSNLLYGLDIWYSNDVIVENSLFENNWFGIYLMWSNSCKVTDSIFRYNEEGIEMYYCGDFYVTLSSFESNTWAGMFVEYSDYLLVSKNDFYNNTNYGVCIQFCTNSQIYLNNFTDNGDQAFDYDSTNNTWYNNITQEGNYWNDYDGISGNYTILGTPDLYDLYPLIDPYIIISEFSFQSFGFWVFIISLTGFFILIPVFRLRRNKLI